MYKFQARDRLAGDGHARSGLVPAQGTPLARLRGLRVYKVFTANGLGGSSNFPCRDYLYTTPGDAVVVNVQMLFNLTRPV